DDVEVPGAHADNQSVCATDKLIRPMPACQARRGCSCRTIGVRGAFFLTALCLRPGVDPCDWHTRWHLPSSRLCTLRVLLLRRRPPTCERSAGNGFSPPRATSCRSLCDRTARD